MLLSTSIYVDIYVFYMLFLTSVPMINTVKNSKDYSQLMRMTYLDIFSWYTVFSSLP